MSHGDSPSQGGRGRKPQKEFVSELQGGFENISLLSAMQKR